MAEQALYQDLLSIYARAGAEVTYETDDGKIKPYWAKRFLQAVKRSEKNDELLQFVDRLLKPDQPSRGFLILKKAGRLDLTVEALVIDPEKPYSGELDFDLVATARRRLADHGYPHAFGGKPQEARPETRASSTTSAPASVALRPGASFDVRITVGDDGNLLLTLI